MSSAKIDAALVSRCAGLRFIVPTVGVDVQRVAPALCEEIAAYGLPPAFAQVIIEVAPVELLEVGRVLELPAGARSVETGVLVSTVRERKLVVDVLTGEVLFLTAQRDYRTNESFAAFVRCVVAYREALDGGSTDLRADVQDADPTALDDPEGIWAEAVAWWEIHQD